MKRTGLMAAVLLAMLMLGMLATACGTPPEEDTTDASAGAAGTTVSGTPGAPQGPTEATIGQAIGLADYTITLTSAKIEDDLLKANFTVDGTKADGGVTIRNLGFTATDTDNSGLSSDIVCSTLPTSIDPHTKVDGALCWKANGTTKTTGIVIKYVPGRSGGRTITWKLP